MTQDFGLSVDARGLIQQLKNNLVDRYPRDSILKELLQNADDARATWLELGWSSGLPDAEHPLLRGPGLFAVNDGPFNPEDGQAIRSFGLNYKAADRSTIGKFGLGLKSVFHLCEAFFFAASNPTMVGSIVNPWCGTGFHQDWNRFIDDDKERVVARLRHLLRDDCWFLLWLPLRRLDHCRIDATLEDDGTDECDAAESELALHGDHPGEENNCPSNLFANQASFFADQLPMLRHLRQVRFWDRWDGSASMLPQFDVKLPEQAPRCRFPERVVDAPNTPCTGVVTIEERGEHFDLSYAMRQIWVSELDGFRTRPGWPKSMSFLSFRPQPDKALPHAAVSLSRCTTNRENGLAIVRAVFLPLRENEENRNSGEATHYSLKLHGCFFVDAGRGSPAHVVLGTANSSSSPEENLRAEWNDQLLRKGICPLVLFVLEEFVRSAGIDDTEIRFLTQSLADSNFYRDCHDNIAISGQWLYSWNRESSRWRRLDDGDVFYEIPHFDLAEPAPPMEALPGLAAVSRNATLTPRRFPRLTIQLAKEWPDDLLAKTLDSRAISFAGWGDRHWSYLQDFLAGVLKAPPGPLALGALALLVRCAFSTTPMQALRKNRNLVQQVVRFLPAASRLALPGLSSWPEKDRKDTLEYPVDLTILPIEFDPPDSPSAGRLNSDQAVELLEFLQPACELQLTSETALAVVKATIDRTALLGHLGFSALKLWIVCQLSAQTRDQAVLSHAQLADELQSMRLFRGNSDKDWMPKELTLLADALRGLTVFGLSPVAADLLFGPEQVPACTSPNIISMLADHLPLLAEPPQRVGLLRHLLHGGEQLEMAGSWRQAIRYLLHAQGEDREGKKSILVGDPRSGGIWGRIARIHLEQTAGDWQVLSPEPLVDLLNPGQQKKAGVVGLDPDGVAALLGIEGASQLTIEFTESERDQILRGWHARPEFLKALPLHDGVHGGRHRIAAGCFWQIRYSLEGKLASRVTLLKPCSNPQLNAIQLPLVDELLPTDVIKLALDDAPFDHWRVILDALAAAGNLPNELRERLLSVDWIPTNGSSAVSPAHVVLEADLALDREIARTLSEAKTALISSSQLPSDVLEHRGLTALRRLCSPSRESLFGKIAGALGQVDARYRIGMRLDDKGEIEDWIAAFADAPSEISPVRNLLARVWGEHHVACQERFLPPLMPNAEDLDITAKRAGDLLSFLSKRHENASPLAKKPIVRVHDRYLKIAATFPEWRSEMLPRLRLLNAKDEWRPVADLCVATGLDAAATLHQEHAALLAGKVDTQKPQVLGKSSGESQATFLQRIDAEWHASATRLKEYFLPWRNASEEYAAWVGAFLSILGDFKPIADAAAEFLPQGHSADAVRAATQLVSRVRRDANGQRHEDSPAEMMRIQRVMVELTDLKPTIRVANLIGQSLSVCPAGDGQDLLIGYGIQKKDIFLADNLQVHCLNLRRVDVAKADRKTVLKWIETTADRVLRDVYGQAGCEFTSALPGLTDRDHEIRAAQAVALNAQHTLRQLGYLDSLELRKVLAEFDRAADRKAEEQVAEENGQELGGRPSEVLERDARENLRGLVSNSEDARDCLLFALRRKLGEYRYRLEAVVFELFQNADDAVVEVGRVASEAFAVRLETSALTVMHQGRPINRPGADGDREKAARDLRKMLALGHSDKGHDPDSPPVTGRFGLGFKSAFLLSDRPQLISGQLAIEVLGGLYPRALARLTADELRSSLKSAGLSEASGTACRLPFRSDLRSEKIAERYQELAAYLCVFARKIRRCLLLDDQGRSSEASWKESWRNEARNVATGTLQSLSVSENLGSRRAITLSANDATLLLPLHDRGIERLPKGVPTVWATAPTEERYDLGFAVNGSFVLDVGRSQVDWKTEDNTVLIEKLGSSFGAALVALFDEGCGEAWAELRRRLGIHDCDFYEFWESIWEVLAADRAQSTPLREMLWGKGDGCLARLYRQRAAMPSGISIPDRRVLTKVEDIVAVLSGDLDSDDPAILRQVAKWTEFSKLPLGSVISYRVWERLARFEQGWIQEVPKIGLPELLDRELNASCRFDAERAALMGMVVTPLRPELKERLKNRAVFLTRLGAWASPRDILLSGGRGNDDETRRAAFAPPSRVLADNYISSAVEFFLACREQANPPIHELAEWARAASTHEQRQAVLRYFREGEHGSRLQEELQMLGIKGSWLEKLDRGQLAAAGFDERRQTVTLVATGALPANNAVPGSQLNGNARSQAFRGGIEKIAEWWHWLRVDKRIEHVQRSVPNGQAVQMIASTDDDSDERARLAWLQLFVGGILATMGRVRLGQNRKFLALCDDREWFRTMLDPSQGPKAWLESVESYIGESTEHIEYFHWLRHSFLGTAFTARHLDSFVAAFRSIDQLKGDWTMRDVLAPRSSHHFSGSGLDVPPIAPILGIGACVVVRELRRGGVIRSSSSHRYCYPPVRRLREFLARLGWDGGAGYDDRPWEQSRSIHEFLSENLPDPTFGGSFDLPLLALIDDESLQQQVLGDRPC